jgi:hypothetical protein
MLAVFAHFGHVLIDAPLFLGPVLILAGTLWFTTRRDRRRGEH